MTIAPQAPTHNGLCESRVGHLSQPKGFSRQRGQPSLRFGVCIIWFADASSAAGVGIADASSAAVVDASSAAGVGVVDVSGFASAVALAGFFFTEIALAAAGF